MDKLYLGVGREIITPEVGGHLFGYNPNIISESIADDLTVTAFYFRQGDTQAMILSSTVCCVRTDLVNLILDEISKRTGIPTEQMMHSCIHTHSGPNLAGSSGWGDIDMPYFETIYFPKVIAAAEQAVKNPVPVTVGVARDKSCVGINRRELTINNKVRLGQNEWGPFNPYMTVFSFRGEDGTTVANFIHYGAHCTAAGKNHEVTRDWAGPMIDALEEKTGGLTAFLNGSMGDVGPRISNGETIGNLSLAYELGEQAAKDALGIYDQIDTYNNVLLRAACHEVTIPLGKRMPAEQARQRIAEFAAATENIGVAIREYLEAVVEAWEQNLPEKKSLSFPQTIVGFGDFLFTAFPLETFSEIEMRIDKYVKEATVLALNQCNGTISYFATHTEIPRGGYEINSFMCSKDRPEPYCDHADFELIKATVSNINAVLSK